MLNIRLVLNYDDGGIRQSERQITPALIALGIKVRGVVVGSELGNYQDQENFIPFTEPTSVSPNTKSFNGNTIKKAYNFIKFIYASNRSSKILYQQLKYEISTEDQVVVNSRRVALLPLAYFLALRAGGKAVYHSGDSFKRNRRSIDFIFYQLIQKLPNFHMLGNSKYSASSYGLSESSYLYPGYEINQDRSAGVSRSELRSKLGIPDDAPVFLFLARLDYEKAPDILAKAFLSSTSVRKHGAHLIFVGPCKDPALVEEIEKMKSIKKGEDIVHLVGRQTNVIDWYRSADVFINSRRGVEPFGISIVEAMSNGLPILSSAFGGPAETVNDGVNGWLIYDLSVSGYREAIELSLENREKWESFSLSSIERSRNFTTESQARRYKDMFYK